MLYLGMRQWLLVDYRLHRARVAFDGHAEEGETPRRPSSAEVKAMEEERDQHINGGGPRDGLHYPVRLHGMKHTSYFFVLPYWSISQLLLSFSQMIIFISRSLYLFLQSSN